MVLRRWSPRSKLLLVLAVVAGAGSFSLVRGYAADLEALRPTGGPVAVVVASRSLERGRVLEEADLALEEIPPAYAPPGAVASISEAVGLTLVGDLSEGEAITETRVGRTGGPVAAAVPSGLRAFVVQTVLPAGVVRPGDRVDVLATFGGPRPYTDTVGADIEVLSVLDAAEDFAAGGADGPSLVLLVSPDAAERLAHATAFGQISVTIAPAASAGP
ncbi:MAG TPA: Flp pilus assembly protein CpaB [Actinomycetota bacterium]|nr:Flp pilus assembly protein CpaB [Actinomycetota bacterium]